MSSYINETIASLSSRESLYTGLVHELLKGVVCQLNFCVTLSNLNNNILDKNILVWMPLLFSVFTAFYHSFSL